MRLNVIKGTCAGSPCSPAYSVNVVLGSVRIVEVNHVLYIRNVCRKVEVTISSVPS